MEEVPHPTQPGIKRNGKTLPCGNCDAYHEENRAPSPDMSDTRLHKTLNSLDDMGDNAPHLKITFLTHTQLRKRGICWSKENAIVTHAQAFYGKVPVNKAYCNIAIVGRERAVNDEQIPLVDTSIHHRVANDTGTESCGRVCYQGTVQVDTIGILALSGTWESGLDPTLKELQARCFFIGMQL